MLASELAPIEQAVEPSREEERDDFVLERIAPIPQEDLKK
jgi:hypothetical protein